MRTPLIGMGVAAVLVCGWVAILRYPPSQRFTIIYWLFIAFWIIMVPDRCSSASDIGKRGNMPRRKSYRAPDSTTEMVGRTTFVPISTRSMALAKADRSSSGTQMLAWTSLRPVSSAGHGYQIQPRGLHRIHDRREFHQRVESAVSRTVLHAAANRTIPVVS